MKKILSFLLVFTFSINWLQADNFKLKIKNNTNYRISSLIFKCIPVYQDGSAGTEKRIKITEFKKTKKDTVKPYLGKNKTAEIILNDVDDASKLFFMFETIEVKEAQNGDWSEDIKKPLIWKEVAAEAIKFTSGTTFIIEAYEPCEKLKDQIFKVAIKSGH